MLYKFIDNKGTFRIDNPQGLGLYFPLTDNSGEILSSISPNLGGDIKKDNGHFLTPPASITDVESNLLCRRDFFISVNNKLLRASYPWKDTLEAGFLYHKLTKTYGNLCLEIINFVPYDLGVEVMWVKAINRGRKNITISPVSCLPLYGRGENNLRDHRHVSSLLNRLQVHPYGLSLKPEMTFNEKGHSLNTAVYFCFGFENNFLAPIGQFPTLELFCGKGNLFFPEAILKNKPGITKAFPALQGKEALAAFRFRERKLKPGQESNYFLIMGIETGIKNSTNKAIKRVLKKLNTPRKISKSLEETKKYWLNYTSKVTFDFKNRDLNNWLRWVTFQPTLRKLFGCSFLPHFDYGKGGRGWRDLWQDALTLLISEPEEAGKLITKSFQGIRIDGSNATIITKNNDFLSDRNSIPRIWMDHGIWPYLCLCFYINKTGDLNILEKDLAYFQDHFRKRNKETFAAGKDFILRTGKGRIYKGSVLEHILVQHLTSFFNVGRHNIIRLENADWNDGLDMAPEFGESVTFSFMFAHNLKDVCNFLRELKKTRKTVFLLKELGLLLDKINRPLDYNSFENKQARLKEYLDKTNNLTGRRIPFSIDSLIYDLEKKSQHLSNWILKHEWLKEGFFNGYYDNRGRKVEGKKGKKTKMMLASQVFAIMSGIASKKQIKELWTEITRNLQDKALGGFRLNTDFGSLYPELGRAFGFSYGDKENGAFFSHMSILLANALYKQGFTAQARKVFNSLYQMSTSDNSLIYPCLPEYFNSQGRGLYLYLTGSASWYTYTLLQETLGINFVMGNIKLQPKLTADDFIKNRIEICLPFAGKIIKFIYLAKKRKRIYSLEKVFLEKAQLHPDSCFIITARTLKTIKKPLVTVKLYLN
ncbi:MAG: cellobiose phosphorylase [Candidatus Omnitrophica bacterium]|nr:cellobiose phosphorylase [Candidatus Omnitrophota bacterium]